MAAVGVLLLRELALELPIVDGLLLGPFLGVVVRGLDLDRELLLAGEVG